VFATLVAAGMLVTFVVATFNRFGYSADALYIPALYRDLVWGAPLRYWGLSESPNFFPEMPLMFTILWATGQNIGLSFVIYGVVYALLLAAAITYLIRGLLAPRWEQAMLALASLCLWTRILLAGAQGSFLLLLVLVPSFHSGVILLATFLLGCTVRMFQRPWPKALAAIWVLCAAGGIAGDPFFLVQFFVPVLFCMYLCRRSAAVPEGPPLGKTAIMGASSAVMAFAGLAAARRMFHLGADTYGPLTVQVTRIPSLFAETYREVFQPIVKGNPAACVLLILGFLLAAGLVVLQYRLLRAAPGVEASADTRNRRVRLSFCMLFFLVAGSATLLFPILTRLLVSVATCRYVEPIYVLPAVILAVSLSLLTGVGNGRARSGVIAAVLVGLVASAAVDGRRLLPERLVPNPPDFVEELDELYRRMGVANGLGNYRMAKPVSLLSRCGVHVDQIVPWEPRHHVNNLYWYLQPGPAGAYALRRYEFIVPHMIELPALLPERVIAKFGPPAAVYQGRTVMAMIYNRKSDVAFRNFLRTRILQEMGKLPPSTIKSPANLREYKPEGLPYDTAGCSIIPGGGRLDVVFDPPGEGDVLEISADNNDQYEAQVRYTDGRSETFNLPLVPENGLRARFLSLSSPQGLPKVQALTIRPLAGDGAYSVGHVFVYEDNW